MKFFFIILCGFVHSQIFEEVDNSSYRSFGDKFIGIGEYNNLKSLPFVPHLAIFQVASSLNDFPFDGKETKRVDEYLIVAMVPPNANEIYSVDDLKKTSIKLIQVNFNDEPVVSNAFEVIDFKISADFSHNRTFQLNFPNNRFVTLGAVYEYDVELTKIYKEGFGLSEVIVSGDSKGPLHLINRPNPNPNFGTTHPNIAFLYSSDGKKIENYLFLNRQVDNKHFFERLLHRNCKINLTEGKTRFLK